MYLLAAILTNFLCSITRWLFCLFVPPPLQTRLASDVHRAPVHHGHASLRCHQSSGEALPEADLRKVSKKAAASENAGCLT